MVYVPPPSEKRSKVIYGFGPMPPKPTQPPQEGDPEFVGPPRPEPKPQEGDPDFVGPPSPRYQESQPGFVGPSAPTEEQAKVSALGVAYEYYHPFPERLRPYEQTLLQTPQGRQAAEIYFQRAISQRYREMSPSERFEYQVEHGELKDLPIEKYKEYEGSYEYLSSQSDIRKEQLLKKYIESKQFQDYLKTEEGKERIKTIRESMAREGLGPLDIVTVVGVPYEKAEKRLARQRLFSDNFEETFWESLDLQVRVKRQFTEGIVSGGLAIPTIVETGLNIGLGTPKPFSKWQQERYISYTPGLIEAPISEAVGIFTGKSSDAFERLFKKPIRALESSFKTSGAFLGIIAGGQIFHVGKVATYRGLGKIRTGISRYTGYQLPGYEQISYYFPQRILRRGLVKLGAKNIDDVMGIPYHSGDTLTPGGLSFAPGRTPSQRISWTIGKAQESRLLPYSQDDIVLAASSGERIGFSFVISRKALHELPALSTTPYGFAPTRFYRFGGPAASYSSQVTLLPKMWRPTGLVTRIQKLFKPPSGSYSYIADWSKAQPKGGWGVIGPKMIKGGPEAEINIFGRTVLKRYLPDISKKTLFQRLKGYQYYTEVPLTFGKKEVVPVVFTQPVHKGFPSAVEIISSKIPSSVKRFISGSPSVPSIPLIRPSYLISKALTPSSNISSSLKSIEISISSSISKSSSSIPSVPSSVSKPTKSITSYPSKSIVSSLSRPSSPSIPSSISISSPSIPKSPSMPSSPSIPSIPSIPPSPPSYLSPRIPFLSDSSSYMIPSGGGQGYEVYVKTRQYHHGKPKGSEKYRLLTRNAFNYNDAMSVLGNVIDNSIAQTGFIKPVDRPPKKLKRSLPNNWSNISYKFDFKNGKHTERREHAIDTTGEVNELDAYKYWRELPSKKTDTGFQISNINFDMYGFDVMQKKFDRLFKRMVF